MATSLLRRPRRTTSGKGKAGDSLKQALTTQPKEGLTQVEAAMGRWALRGGRGASSTLQLPSACSRGMGFPCLEFCTPCRTTQILGRRWSWAEIRGPDPASLPPSPHHLSTYNLFVPVVNLEKMSSLPSLMDMESGWPALCFPQPARWPHQGLPWKKSHGIPF